MAASIAQFLYLALLLTAAVSIDAGNFGFEAYAESMEQWESPLSIYNADLGGESGVEDEMVSDAASIRRSLIWKKLFHYYISYGALSANRVPCPPRSGRSYYTHNCFRARGPVHPYSRSCSAITLCRR